MTKHVKKIFFYILFLLLIQPIMYAHDHNHIELLSACCPPQRSVHKQKKMSVLSIFTSHWMGGAEMCALAIHKLLHQASYNAYMLVYKDSPLQKYIQELYLPHYTTNVFLQKNKNDWEQSIKQQIRIICCTRKIKLVQCHTPAMAQLVRAATQGLRLKIVLMYHGIDAIDFSKFEKLDGVITVNPSNEPLIRQANNQLKLGIKKITQIYPFFNEERFLKFKPKKLTRQDFFKQYDFDVSEHDAPVISMVANFYGKLKNPLGDYASRKNQELLIRALHVLINECGKKAYVVFLGDGPDRASCAQLSKDLGIDQFICFAGFCKEVEAFLYYTDIHVLTSALEPLGIVYLEAGLMKKPSLGACGTGADYTIVDGVTGFIFKNNDLKDVVDKLEILIDNSALRIKMGHNAFAFVTGRDSFNLKKRAFLATNKFQKLEAFYKQLCF
ncbi:glycosyltransferase family 4 protein [Candidatus Dependentiae bacterium]|nr:glycosyltransferase family 4 protein [Candidatus Dependentiae bacterium]